MFHDLVLSKENYLECIERYKNFTDDPLNSRLMLELLAKTMAFVIGSKPHVFYMDRDNIDQNIIDTGHDFYREGILKFPYEECMFVFDNSIAEDHHALTKNKREAFLFRKISDLDKGWIQQQIQKQQQHMPEGEMFDYVFMKLTEAINYNGKIMAFPDPNLHFIANNASHGEYGAIALKPLVDLGHMSKQAILEMEENAKNSIGTTVGALMFLNTKYVDKTERKIDFKLNKSRAKSGKPALMDYTVVNLKQAYGGASSGRSHDSPKPHWRRGHIRRLENKVVPVQPCMVNFEGDEVLPKTYKVKAS